MSKMTNETIVRGISLKTQESCLRWLYQLVHTQSGANYEPRLIIIDGAFHAHSPLFNNVRIYFRCCHIGMTQQLLKKINRTSIVIVISAKKINRKKINRRK